jgi:hypothetical protein
MHSSKTQNNSFAVDAGEKWAFHHIFTTLFHSIFFRGHSEVSKLQIYPQKEKKRKEKSLRICLWVVLWMPIHQNYVQSLISGFCFSIL